KAERTATGEQIGDAQVLEAAEAAREHREQGFADAIGCRPGGLARRRFDHATAPRSGDDAHQILPGTGRQARISGTDGGVDPSTTELRSAVPLPVPGRITSGSS